MLKVIAVFKTDLFAKIANITATLQIAFLLTWQGTPVAGFTGTTTTENTIMDETDERTDKRMKTHL